MAVHRRLLRHATRTVLSAGFATLPLEGHKPGRPERANGTGVVVVGSPRYQPGTPIYWTSIWGENHPNAWQAAAYLVSPRRELYRTCELYGTVSADEAEGFARAQALRTNTEAAAVALRLLGWEVTRTGHGATVDRVGPTSLLREHDVIVGFDAEPVTDSRQLAELVAARRPGETVELTVLRANAPAVVSERLRVELGAFDDGSARLGVGVSTWRLHVDAPVSVTFPATGGGPSGGLATALATLDVLTPGDLAPVPTAVTGRIDMDGNVGAVDGVHHKARGLRRSDTRLFLVPAGLGTVARAHAPARVEVVEVSTLEDALAALAERGGAPVVRPTC